VCDGLLEVAIDLKVGEHEGLWVCGPSNWIPVPWRTLLRAVAADQVPSVQLLGSPIAVTQPADACLALLETDELDAPFHLKAVLGQVLVHTASVSACEMKSRNG
jgi:hypothetical protein